MNPTIQTLNTACQMPPHKLCTIIRVEPTTAESTTNAVDGAPTSSPGIAEANPGKTANPLPMCGVECLLRRRSSLLVPPNPSSTTSSPSTSAQNTATPVGAVIHLCEFDQSVKYFRLEYSNSEIAIDEEALLHGNLPTLPSPYHSHTSSNLRDDLSGGNPSLRLRQHIEGLQNISQLPTTTYDHSNIYNSTIINNGSEPTPFDTASHNKLVNCQNACSNTLSMPTSHMPLQGIFPTAAPRFLDLAVLPTGVESTFYGCIVDVSRMCRPLPRPRTAGPSMPQFVTLNVDVVDPSLVDTFSFGASALNSIARINITIIASKEPQLPMVEFGDIIRVSGAKLTPHQDVKTGNIFLDVRTNPALTSVCLWRLAQLEPKVREQVVFTGARRSQSVQQSESQDPTAQEPLADMPATAYAVSPTKVDQVAPYWQSQGITAGRTRRQLVGQDRSLGRLQEFSASGSTEKSPTKAFYEDSNRCITNGLHITGQEQSNHLSRLTRWAVTSLQLQSCLTSSYSTTLERLLQIPSNRFVDLLVCITHLHDGTITPSESSLAFNEDDSIVLDAGPNLPDSASLVDSRSSRNSAQSFKVFVEDESSGAGAVNATTQRIQTACWILSNFSPHDTVYLASTLRKGDWIKVKNVCWHGTEAVCPGPTAGLPGFFLDASRARVLRITSLCRWDHNIVSGRLDAK